MPRIVGGKPAEPGSVPHQISLEYFGGHICGGSIISDEWVVCAAHCAVIAGADSFTIRAGVHNIDNPESVSQQVKVAQKIVHADYDDFNLSNDISLFRLSSKLTLSQDQRTAAIALADTGFDATGTFTVTGWGTLTAGGNSPSELHTVEVPHIDDATCREAYAGQNDVADSMICAGDLNNGGIDSCQGDSGGPLYINSETPTLVGIVSWGIGCAEAGYPGVYTEVSHFRDWIKENAGV